MEPDEVSEPGVEVEGEDEAIPELTVAEVAARLGQPGFHVYDTNARGRWKRSHVPGAKCVDPYDFDRSELPEDVHATLVFYCSGPG
jgi:rhodanese-like protein